MRQLRQGLCIALLLMLVPKSAKADMAGADVAVLLEILSNNISQLYQLYEIVNRAKQNLELMKEVNKGFDDSLKLVKKIKNLPDAGIYGDWDSVEKALTNLQSAYGSVPQSVNASMQQNTDRTVAEAINMNTNLYSYADELNSIGGQIESYSHSVSPKGAARLTAQSMGLMLQAMNQSMRAQATGIKLQAQDLASKNRREKEETRAFVKTTALLSSSLRTHNSKFETPRFQ